MVDGWQRGGNWDQISRSNASQGKASGQLIVRQAGQTKASAHQSGPSARLRSMISDDELESSPRSRRAKPHSKRPLLEQSVPVQTQMTWI